MAARAVRDHDAEVVGPFHVKWDVAGRCQDPVPVQLYGRRDERGQWWDLMTNSGPQRLKSRSPMALDIETRCRRCGPCLRARAALWRARALTECRAAQRSWFGTLTLAPEAHVQVDSHARSYLDDQGVDFDALSFDERFKERILVINQTITKFLKRVRKNTGADLRYLIVAEAHKSGLPHFHLLVHEVTGVVTHRRLKEAWRAGFSDFKLILSGDEKAASYVTKYLTKSALARVRASLGYGDPPSLASPLAIDRGQSE